MVGDSNLNVPSAKDNSILSVFSFWTQDMRAFFRAGPMQLAQKQIRSKISPECKLCGGQGRIVYEGLADPFFNAPGSWILKKCNNLQCGLSWLDPTPFPEDLHLAYKRYFTHGKLDAAFGIKQHVRTLLYKAYQALASAPAILTGLQKDKKQAKLMYLNARAKGKLLDVGCGDGSFLHRMRQLGWAVAGVDFDDAAIQNAKLNYALELYTGDLSSVELPSNSFDAITLSHVIEHVPDFFGLLGETHRLLKPGGQLVVTTPNGDSMGHKMFGRNWFGLDAPRHLQIFSMNALNVLAARINFVRSKIFSTAANADIFIGASYSIKESADHRTSAQPAPNVLRTIRAIKAQYKEYNLLRADPMCGEEAVLICFKKES
jgi:2-polyprenyl-3-methyl-5-hydroxy-6-metoxy-1,4-benzoquinol methylase